MIYRADIDGLRALAVLPVIFFHGGIDAFRGGFLGVDIFFVISGYLIACILIRDIETGRFSIIGFYERRIRRILPALFVVMAATAVLAFVWMPPLQFKDFAQSLVATSLFSSNILFWMESGYFETAAERKPLLHTWSLAVEEQYYAVFPIVLALLWRPGALRLTVVVSLVALASLGLAEWISRTHPSAAFYLAPFRVWELLAGAIAALAEHRRAPRPNNWLAGLGLVAICTSMILYDGEDVRVPSLMMAIPVAGAVAVIHWGGRSTIVGRLLSLRPLIWIGLISYSAYLWHQPLFAFARIRSAFEPSTALVLSLTVLTLALAWMTWAWVEQPLRHRRGTVPLLPRRTSLFAATFVGLTAYSTLGIWGHLTDGRAERWIRSFPPEHRVLLARIETAERRHRSTEGQPFDDGDCIFGARRVDRAFVERMSDCYDRYGAGLVVLGDSHAIDLFGMLRASDANERRFVVGLARGGCLPGDLDPSCLYDSFLDLVRLRPELVGRILFHQAGWRLLDVADEGPASRESFQIPLTQELPAMHPAPDRVETVTAYLNSLQRIVPVTWIGSRLEPHIPLELIIRYGCNYQFELRPNQRAIFERLDATLYGKAIENEIQFYSLIEELALHFPDDLHDCPEVYWSDGDHLSEDGEQRFGARLSLPGEIDTSHHN